eukprot:105820-Chlamydomonas_euryale.AAC.2
MYQHGTSTQPVGASTPNGKIKNSPVRWQGTGWVGPRGKRALSGLDFLSCGGFHPRHVKALKELGTEDGRDGAAV